MKRDSITKEVNQLIMYVLCSVCVALGLKGQFHNIVRHFLISWIKLTRAPDLQIKLFLQIISIVLAK